MGRRRLVGIWQGSGRGLVGVWCGSCRGAVGSGRGTANQRGNNFEVIVWYCRYSEAFFGGRLIDPMRQLPRVCPPNTGYV